MASRLHRAAVGIPRAKRRGRMQGSESHLHTPGLHEAVGRPRAQPAPPSLPGELNSRRDWVRCVSDASKDEWEVLDGSRRRFEATQHLTAGVPPLPAAAAAPRRLRCDFRRIVTIPLHRHLSSTSSRALSIRRLPILVGNTARRSQLSACESGGTHYNSQRQLALPRQPCTSFEASGAV